MARSSSEQVISTGTMVPLVMWCSISSPNWKVVTITHHHHHWSALTHLWARLGPLLPKQVPGGEVDVAKVLNNAGTLSALTRPGAPQHKYHIRLAHHNSSEMRRRGSSKLLMRMQKMNQESRESSLSELTAAVSSRVMNSYNNDRLCPGNMCCRNVYKWLYKFDYFHDKVKWIFRIDIHRKSDKDLIMQGENYLDSSDLKTPGTLEKLVKNRLPLRGNQNPIKSLISKSIYNFC